MLRVLKKAGHPLDASTYDVARRSAQGACGKVAEMHLRNHDIKRFDQAFEEGEVKVDDQVRAALEAKVWPVTTTTMTDAQKRQVLTATERDQALGDLTKAETLPSDVDAILADNGIDLPNDHPDRHKLALAILRAEVNAYRTLRKRRDADTAETPDRPAKIELPPQGATIGAMRLKWINEVRPGTKATDDNALYVRRFIDLHGDGPVAAITRKMVIAFRDELAKCPRNPAKAVMKGSLQEQIASAAAKPNCRLLTRQTVNAKGIGSISTLLRVAIKHGDLQVNVCDGTLFDVDGCATERLPYSVADLNKIYTSPIYVAGERWTAGGGEAQFWFPLVGLFAGPQLEEIGQLLVDDVRTERKIVYFDFTETDEEADAADTMAEVKALKTRNARRKVPVHPFLIEIGFLRHVARMKAEGFRRLLPHLAVAQGKLTHNWSKWWGRHTDRYVTMSAQKVFHSLRHNFSERVRDVTEGKEEAVAALIGHTTHMYGRAISLETRYEIICKLDYPAVDFSHVKAAARTLSYMD